MATIYHFSSDEKEATSFWGKAISGLDMRATDPEKVMVERLTNALSEGGTAPINAKRARIAARCWKAFVSGEVIKKVVVPDRPTPIHIEGTPFVKNLFRDSK